MKIDKIKVMKFRIFAIFMKHFLNGQYMNMQLMS